MVYDVVYLLNELDLLEIRLNILNEYVDFFVIVESPLTFSGVPKDLIFKDNSNRFKKWEKKIIYFVADLDDIELFLIAIGSPCVGNGEHYWIREFVIKESARKALIELRDNDIVFISDMDEIWNPDIVYSPKDDEILKPKQLPYLYYFNQRSDEDWLGWSGTIVTRYETIKNGIINHLRTDELTKFTVIENGGWHFNAIGGKQQKQKASKHPVVNTDADWNRREINLRIDESHLPKYLIENKSKWTHLFKVV